MKRQENLERAKSAETWDVVVIGGGATGLGIAVDANGELGAVWLTNSDGVGPSFGGMACQMAQQCDENKYRFLHFLILFL